ncbi:uncharacterized protein LOC129587442 [Paramacrobiotus metropolitanus]|uniref:uncharacterized protein LOC129587442 n=1 Tax=Paramacrobiotus metropolitanus TaxID=2943436 RepID=UPI00244642A3|nr:uncharacterized protein LOC129587442 [Paramacrobiotus metropolitanus]
MVPEISKKIKCDICGKTIVQKLERHKRSGACHSKNPDYLCSYAQCERSRKPFTRPSDAKRHRETCKFRPSNTSSGEGTTEPQPRCGSSRDRSSAVALEQPSASGSDNSDGDSIALRSDQDGCKDDLTSGRESVQAGNAAGKSSVSVGIESPSLRAIDPRESDMKHANEVSTKMGVISRKVVFPPRRLFPPFKKSKECVRKLELSPLNKSLEMRIQLHDSVTCAKDFCLTCCSVNYVKRRRTSGP